MKHKIKDPKEIEEDLQEEIIRLRIQKRELNRELRMAQCTHNRGFRNSGRSDKDGMWIMECPDCGKEEFNWFTG
jgi:hypothetical protein